MSDLETTGNPVDPGQALTVSGAADAFRQLNIGKPAEAPAEEKPEATANAHPEGADVPDEEAEAPPEEKSEGEDESRETEAKFDEKAKRYTVKIDGEELKVSFEELRNGYQRASVTLAKAREAEKARAEADAQRQAYLDRIQSVVPQLEQLFSSDFADIKTIADVQKLAVEDPARYTKWDAAQKALNMARGERERLAHEAQQAQEAKLKSYLEDQQKQLVKALPEWADEERGPKLKTDLQRYLRAEGFADDELGNVADHRLVVIARKAMLYDRAQKGLSTAAKKIAEVPKVQKPGSTTKANPNAEATHAAFERLNKSGRVDDAASVFKGMKIFG